MIAPALLAGLFVGLAAGWLFIRLRNRALKDEVFAESSSDASSAETYGLTIQRIPLPVATVNLPEVSSE